MKSENTTSESTKTLDSERLNAQVFLKTLRFFLGVNDTGKNAGLSKDFCCCSFFCGVVRQNVRLRKNL